MENHCSRGHYCYSDRWDLSVPARIASGFPSAHWTQGSAHLILLIFIRCLVFFFFQWTQEILWLDEVEIIMSQPFFFTMCNQNMPWIHLKRIGEAACTEPLQDLKIMAATMIFSFPCDPSGMSYAYLHCESWTNVSMQYRSFLEFSFTYTVSPYFCFYILKKKFEPNLKKSPSSLVLLWIASYQLFISWLQVYLKWCLPAGFYSYSLINHSIYLAKHLFYH